MIHWDIYQKLVVEHLNRKISTEDNPDQNKAISAPITESQFLVAGPGVGNPQYGLEDIKIHICG